MIFFLKNRINEIFAYVLEFMLTFDEMQNFSKHNAVSDQDLHCLLTECSIRNWKKLKISPKQPYNWNGLILLIREGKSIVLKWVKTHQ